MKKFYLTLAVGALSAAPLFAADPAPAAAPAAPAEAPKAEAPKVDVWANIHARLDGLLAPVVRPKHDFHALAGC